ncbi:MAG TPA: tetratricopeptide repeat protein [Candidatus Angelobacter sp.]|nr:tetratricopeptide repeat protein [Candidatus Angelobacter sp.]
MTLLLGPLAALRAAGAAEGRAYEVAANMFRGGSYALAEKEFADFIKNHPDSEKIPEAVLLQAECRYQLKRFDDALALLRERLANAGRLADQYRYWIPECLFQKGDYAGAAAAFAGMLNDFGDSPRRLEASLGEAYARFKLGDLQKTAELLSQPGGAFQQAAQKRMNEEVAIRGQLLLAQAYLGLKKYREGEDALGRLADRQVPAELNRQRLYLLARLKFSGGQLDAALQTTTNLLGELSAATNATTSNLVADAAVLQGEILEQKNEPESAIRAYEINLSTNAPMARRREALQQIVKLTLAQNKIGEAGTRLEKYVASNPADPLLDLLRLTLGELRLKEYFERPEAARPGATNLLLQAKSQFDQIIANTNKQFVARAQLDRGWCLWEDGFIRADTNKLAASGTAFRAAVEQLPPSQEQAVARIKWADCQFGLADYAGALTNYWLVATNHADMPRVQAELAGLALYQIVRASIQLGNLPSADQAVARILSAYPDGDESDRSALLYGQALNRLGDPARAREFFAGFTNRFPQSSMLPEVELGIARTYEQEENWGKALELYDQWLAGHSEHPLRPKVEFDRAWASYLAGNEGGALRYFADFVARFPTNSLAPQAQIWIADYYYRLGGTNYVNADENYQKVFQNPGWPRKTELYFRAMMMAGRAAYARQGYRDATNYFTRLIKELTQLNTPSSLLPSAYLALADTYVQYPEAAGATNTLENFKQAIEILGKIPREFPTNTLVPAAWGRIGDCYLQVAGQTQDAKDYDRAMNAYTNALDPTLPADATCRSGAEVGLARALEMQSTLASSNERTNLLNEALRHYLYVVDGKNLRENETADPFWVKKAADEAARLAESQQLWEVAANLYRRLIDELAPALRKTWELKLEKLAQPHLSAEKPKN